MVFVSEEKQQKSKTRWAPSPDRRWCWKGKCVCMSVCLSVCQPKVEISNLVHACVCLFICRSVYGVVVCRPKVEKVDGRVCVNYNGCFFILES